MNIETTWVISSR